MNNIVEVEYVKDNLAVQQIFSVCERKTPNK